MRSYAQRVGVVLSLLLTGCGQSGPSLAPLPEARQQCLTASNEQSIERKEVTLRVGRYDTTRAKVWLPQPTGLSAARPKSGMLFVSGVDGGFEEPVDGIYSRMAEEYARLGIPSIFVQYRCGPCDYEGALAQSVEDALAGVSFLKGEGVERIALLAWSFGGAVMVNTAVRAPEIRSIVGFAPQAKDTEAVSNFKDQSILLFHSRDDENVPFEASGQILELAPPSVHKEFHALQGTDHHLTGEAGSIDPLVMNWLDRALEDGVCLQSSNVHSAYRSEL